MSYPDGLNRKSDSTSFVESLADTSKRRLEAIAKAQSELAEELQGINAHWLDRLQAESRANADYFAKLSAAKTVPDVVVAGQEWATKRLERMAENGKLLLTDMQKFASTTAELFSNGSSGNGPTQDS